jgi:hypothetical protein
MRFHAYAAVACAALSLGAHAAPKANKPPAVSFKAPVNGQTVSGWLDGPTCEALASDANGVTQVQFFFDATPLNTEGLAPWNCTVNTQNFVNGTHTLKAVATDSKGAVGTAQITINVQNAAANTPPAVSFKAPLGGQTVSGWLDGPTCEALASDADGVKQVQFFFDSTALNTEGVAPWNCTVNTQNFADGPHTLKAVATDTKGAVGTAQITVNVQNAGAKAIPTFESLGLYWKPPSDPGSAGCPVRYRRAGDSAWLDGLAMWYDVRNGECRGSLVHLTPATSYEVELSVPGQPAAQLTASTWSEAFPIARIVEVPSGSTTLAITEGGSPSGYVLYTSPAGTQSTLDAANGQNYNITVAAPYVIVRGLVLKGAAQDAIRLLPGARDVVVEDNDISGWGRFRATSSTGVQLGMDMDAGVRAVCADRSLERVVIQRNRIHHPRYSANSWSFGHPAGPQAVTFSHCGGNHVIRHNEIYSEAGRYFNDALGGESNFSDVGFPNADSDIYGNRISHAWDDAIEAEGANRNVRIWGNYIDQTAIGVASSATHSGPLYIFRNVYNRSRQLSEVALDSDDRNNFAKAGTTSSFGNGRRYVFHNTTLQATQAGVSYGLGAGGGLAGNTNQPMTNTVSRNNILDIWKSWWSSINTVGGAGNDLDYDLFNGNVTAYAGAEPNGILGTPVYAPGHGWVNESGGYYQLDPSSVGHDRGVRLPNFNDGFLGAAPDMGAHETGSPAMRFGLR